MKNTKKRVLKLVERTATSVTSSMVNSGCLCLMYQPKLPKNAEKLRKK